MTRGRKIAHANRRCRAHSLRRCRAFAAWANIAVPSNPVSDSTRQIGPISARLYRSGRKYRVVELQNVTKRYGGRRPLWAVRDVSLRVERGEMLAIMGPSGSGKSTLLNLVGGLDSPSEGTILVDGLDLGSLDDDRRTRLRREGIGFVFQFFNLLPTLTAWENVAFPLHLAGLARTKSRATAAGVLAQVGLGDRRDHLPDELSGGEQQRVAIARAVVANPFLIPGR